MGLDLAGVERIDTPAEARSRARKWLQMAREIDTPDAPDQAKEKVRELRARAKAAQDWARREEDAIAAGQREHDAELERHSNVVPLHADQAEQGGHQRRARAAARRAGHVAYHRTRPPAMRIVHRGRQHFFQGLSEPFGPIGSSWDLLWEGIGVTLGIVILTDLLRAPGAIGETSKHLVAAVDRAVGLADPITGLAPAPAVAHGSARPAQTPAKKTA